MSKGLLLVGGGGHCRSVLDSVLAAAEFSNVAIVDLPENVGRTVFGVPVVGDDDDLPSLFHSGYTNAVVTIGSIGNVERRVALFDRLRDIGFCLPIIIDPSAVVSSHANLEAGVYVGKKAVVNAGASIGKGAIVNTGAVIEHDCDVGSFVHIAPGAVLGGNVRVGENTHVGIGSIVKQGITIGSNCIIGMGSVVIECIEDSVIAYGNPCKVVRLR